MGKYFFDVNGNGVRDLAEGEIFENDEAAWHEATCRRGDFQGRRWRL
jgi:hypothetical protein